MVTTTKGRGDIGRSLQRCVSIVNTFGVRGEAAQVVFVVIVVVATAASGADVCVAVGVAVDVGAVIVVVLLFCGVAFILALAIVRRPPLSSPLMGS